MRQLCVDIAVIKHSHLLMPVNITGETSLVEINGKYVLIPLPPKEFSPVFIKYYDELNNFIKQHFGDRGIMSVDDVPLQF